MIDPTKKTLIPYMMAGYPDLPTCESLIAALVEEGIEILELGVPFSDPLADGPTIQMAAAQALHNGTTLQSTLDLVARLKRRHPRLKLILFTYLNPLLKFGLARFVEEADSAGVAATLTVDLPPEEADEYLRLHRSAGVGTVFLASPTTAPARLPRIAAASSAFVYYVSRVGVTGSQHQLSQSLAAEVQKVRALVACPLAVGFGICTAQQVAEVARLADAAVVGSHILNLIATHPQEPLAPVRQFVRQCLDLLAGGGNL